MGLEINKAVQVGYTHVLLGVIYCMYTVYWVIFIFEILKVILHYFLKDFFEFVLEPEMG